MPNKKGTVLLFHGWAQNARVFDFRCQRLLRKLRSQGFVCRCLKAPHVLPTHSTVIVDGSEVSIENGKRKDARAWFLYNADDPADASLALSGELIEYVGIEESLCLVADELERVGGPVSVIGFSQGATFCHILCILASRQESAFSAVQKAVFIGGFPATHRPGNGSLYFERGSDTLCTVLSIPSLSVVGKNDTSVSPDLSFTLSRLFRASRAWEHQKGHIVPQHSIACETILEFLIDTMAEPIA